jgi:hypothetical protein
MLLAAAGTFALSRPPLFLCPICDPSFGLAGKLCDLLCRNRSAHLSPRKAKTFNYNMVDSLENIGKSLKSA